MFLFFFHKLISTRITKEHTFDHTSPKNIYMELMDVPNLRINLFLGCDDTRAQTPIAGDPSKSLKKPLVKLTSLK